MAQPKRQAYDYWQDQPDNIVSARHKNYINIALDDYAVKSLTTSSKTIQTLIRKL